jgi:hypothetical protein
MRSGRFLLIVALWTTAAVACTSITRSGSKKGAATTTTALGPIATANQAIAAWARSRQGSTAVSIGDIDDGVVTDLGVVPQVPVRIGSVMKVSIAIAFLRTLKEQGRDPDDDDMARLTGMIEQSDNDDATALWNASDGPLGLRSPRTPRGSPTLRTKPGTAGVSH